MKTNLLLTLLSFTVILFSCEKKYVDENPDTNVTVIAKSNDCEENTYLLKFDENVTGLVNNIQDFTFYEINLPDEFKVINKKLNVTFRQPKSEEYMDCGDPFIKYPQIFIISVE